MVDLTMPGAAGDRPGQPLNHTRRAAMGRARRRQSGVAWMALALILLPAAGMLLFSTHLGRGMMERMFAPSEPVALLSGMTLEDAPPPASGLIVTSLRSHSPAVSAGVAVGDTLQSMDGYLLPDLDRAREYLRYTRKSAIAVKLVHNRHARTIVLPRGGDWTDDT